MSCIFAESEYKFSALASSYFKGVVVKRSKYFCGFKNPYQTKLRSDRLAKTLYILSYTCTQNYVNATHIHDSL